MSDDWRLRVDLHEHGRAHGMTERLEASTLEHDLESAFEDRVVVSRAGAEIFCYAATREQAERAERLIRSLAAEHGWHLESELRRWHPVAEDWEEPDRPLPESLAEHAAEHEALIENQREETEARGFPEFEVRVQCPSHREALRFVAKLREEGLESVHRWKYVLVGASDEDSATALAQRLRQLTPPGSTVIAEGTLNAVLAERPPNPFAVWGGLGG